MNWHTASPTHWILPTKGGADWARQYSQPEQNSDPNIMNLGTYSYLQNFHIYQQTFTLLQWFNSWDTTQHFPPCKLSERRLYQIILYRSHLNMWNSPNPHLNHPDSLFQTLDRPGQVAAGFWSMTTYCTTNSNIYYFGLSSLQGIDHFHPPIQTKTAMLSCKVTFGDRWWTFGCQVSLQAKNRAPDF